MLNPATAWQRFRKVAVVGEILSIEYTSSSDPNYIIHERTKVRQFQDVF
jgi:hypothetical protein